MKSRNTPFGALTTCRAGTIKLFIVAIEIVLFEKKILFTVNRELRMSLYDLPEMTEQNFKVSTIALATEASKGLNFLHRFY